MQANTDTKTPILVCGLLAADVVFNVEVIPTRAIKHRAETVALRCGGGGCYAAIAINRLGGNSIILAKTGDDDFGKFIRNTLDSEGIDLTHVIINPHAHTPISSIAIDPDGERQIVNYRDQTPAEFVGELAFSSSPRSVLVDGRWVEGSVRALEYARLHELPGVIDAEAPVSEDAMDVATHIAFSRQGLSQFSATDSVLAGLRKAAARFSAWVCVTDGKNGTHILSNNLLKTVAAPNVKSVDTLGAGDVWHGAFALQLAQSVRESDAVRFANVVAALKCTRVGGGWSAPELREVTEFDDTAL